MPNNIPDKANVIALKPTRSTYHLIDSLVAELFTIERDPSVPAIVLTGTGRAFSAGADIAGFRESVAEGVDIGVREFCRRGQHMTAFIENFPKPIISAVNGIAFGGGCEIVEATHITVAAASATFGKPEIKLGMVPTFGGTERLPRLVGRKRALRALLSGEPFDAVSAREIGLVNEIVADKALLETAIAIARSFTRHSAGALRTCLAAVTRGLNATIDNATIDEGLWIEARQFAVNVASDDLREGMAAFVEKRPACWTDR